MQSTLLEGVTQSQAVGSEEDTVRRLENYTGLFSGLQKLVEIMAAGYEDATEDIPALVTSALDAVTEQDRTFIAGASQALAEWTTTYQQAMSQGEHQSISDQLARWDWIGSELPYLARYNPSLWNMERARRRARYFAPSYQPVTNGYGIGPRPPLLS